jgi:DNA-damage-inducible protein J
MARSAMVRARIEPRLKSDVEAIFQKIGLNASEAITVFYSHVKLSGGIPFDVKIPNKTNRKVIEDSRRRKDFINSKSAAEIFKTLKI